MARPRRPQVQLPKQRPQASQTTAPDPTPASPVRTDHDVARAASSVRPQAATAAATSKVQEQVGVAATLADRMTAITASPVAPTATDRAKGQPDGRLVAVLMARPSVKTLSELRGRTIAIDGRYAASMGKVATAIGAAGAPDVQLLDGQGTAINRLTNGEVVAAVVALVSPEAADAFPELAGFRLFQVPVPAQ